MLSLEHPEVMEFLAGAGPGIWPLKSKKLGLVLAIKGSADLAFAAKHRRHIRFHFYQLDIANKLVLGLITAVYDRSASPLVVQTVFIDSVMRKTASELLSKRRIGVYFFDAHNSELFGGRWKLSKKRGVRKFIATKFSNVKPSRQLEAYVALKKRFSNPEDDGFVMEASLISSNQPGNVGFIHFTQDSVASRRNEGAGVYFSNLSDNDRPGDSQESLLARLLTKHYLPKRVFVNPQIGSGREFCDVLAIGNHEALAVQAKSTIQDVARFEEADQKRNTRLNKHFRKALAQAKGAERAFYHLRKDILFEEDRVEIAPNSHLLIHIIVLHDKSPSLFPSWSVELSALATKTTPVVVLDLFEFTNMVNMCANRELLVSALMTIAEQFSRDRKIREYQFGREKIAAY